MMPVIVLTMKFVIWWIVDGGWWMEITLFGGLWRVDCGGGIDYSLFLSCNDFLKPDIIRARRSPSASAVANSSEVI